MRGIVSAQHGIKCALVQRHLKALAFYEEEDTRKEEEEEEVH